jgi:hypothetical protein
MDPSSLLAGTYVVKGAALVLAVALVLGARAKPAVVGLVGAAALLLLVGVLRALSGEIDVDDRVFGFDYRIFHEAGRDVLAGRDPYAADRLAEHPFLNPPTALPLFALFAAAPFGASLLVWTVLNAAACLALLPGAQRSLAAVDRPAVESGGWRLPAIVMAGLVPALLLSEASLVCFYLGQLGIFVAVALVAALYARAVGRPVLAGVCLAAATVKVTTMLPFLMLFNRRSDFRSWVAMSVAVLGLCLATGGPAALPLRVGALAARFGDLASPGNVNDYSFEGPRSDNILGFDHAFYRVGLRDRGLIGAAQLLAVAALGAWVACEVLGKHRLPYPAACSLVAFYSIVFFYHRSYDTTVLALPLVYCAGRARSATGWQRFAFAFCAVSVLLVWYLDVNLLAALREFAAGRGRAGRLIQAAVLPYATWLVAAAMFVLVMAVRRAPAESVR